MDTHIEWRLAGGRWVARDERQRTVPADYESVVAGRGRTTRPIALAKRLEPNRP